VDDDRMVLKALERYFSRSSDLVVRTAASVHEAMAEARETPPEIVILDIHLPDGTGFDLLKQLRKVGNPDLPAIAYTGHSDTGTLDSAETAGFNACFTKGALLSHLAQEVQRWIH